MNNLAAGMIPDVQNFADNRHMAIQQVGIKDIRHPVRIINNAGEEQATVARVSMDVSLPAHLKGTHMSRFIALLNEQGPSLSAGRLDALLREMALRLEAQEGRIELSFPYFVKKAAPVSGVESLLDYQVTLRGTIADGTVNVETQVVIAATSLCPCSKEISRYGAHNQRSHITATVQADPDLGLEELIAMVEAQASCEVYGLLKRPDEKYVTERAYDNPKFVEDMVRDVAIRLAGDKRITAYDVLVENFESIHNHSAFARIRSH